MTSKAQPGALSAPPLWILVLLGMLLTALGVAVQETTPPPTLPDSNRGRTPTPACNGKVEAPVLVHKVEPQYPVTLRRQRVEGLVVLEGIITRDGNVEGITILKNPSNDLSKLALVAFRQWRYKPALCDGKPVRVYVTTTMRFSLH